VEGSGAAAALIPILTIASMQECDAKE